jgi:hypothetical protein
VVKFIARFRVNNSFLFSDSSVVFDSLIKDIINNLKELSNLIKEQQSNKINYLITEERKKELYHKVNLTTIALKMYIQKTIINQITPLSEFLKPIKEDES